MTQPKILVAGIGNIFLGDDGFGCAVLKELNLRSWPANVRVFDFGIRGFDLAYALLDGYDVAILVDATPHGEAPGTLYTIEPGPKDFEAFDANVGMIETHGMNPLKVLSLVKSMGGEFKKVLVVGCEPETFGPEEGQLGLSQAVERAVPAAVKIVETLVAKHLEAAAQAVA
ncbi:MAG TPA: hydrogenase maturation protease [Pyrinomonadaceae bacterium]